MLLVLCWFIPRLCAAWLQKGTGYRQNLAPKENENRIRETTRGYRNDGGKCANEDDDEIFIASATSLLVTTGGKKHSRLEFGPPRLCVLCEDDVAGSAFQVVAPIVLLKNENHPILLAIYRL